MSSTVAVDGLRVDDRVREPAVVGTADVSEPPWSRRSLNDALANLGPAKPAARADVEPWSRATLQSPLDIPASAIANAEDASRADASTAHNSSIGDRDGFAPPTSIPPPPRLSRLGPQFDAVEAFRPPVIFDFSKGLPTEFDAAGVELVKALAAADLARHHQSGGLTAPAESDMDMMGPAPIIIERARAEQELGVVPALPKVPWANPLRGLAVGFSLSLATGAVLYLMLTSG